MNKEETSAEADRRQLVRFWSWRGWPYLAVGVLFAAAALVVSLLTHTPRYKATHLLEANNEFILYQNVMPKLENLAETETPIVFSSLVLDAVLLDPSLRNAPSLSNPDQADRNLRANLSVEEAGSKQRMRINYIDTDRAAAATVCNAVVSTYLRTRADNDQSRVNKIESLLVPEIDHWKNEVEKLKGNYQELSRTLAGGNGSPESQAIEAERYRRLRLELFDLEKEIDVLKATVDHSRDASDSSADEKKLAGTEESSRNTDLVEMEIRLNVLRKKLRLSEQAMERRQAVSTKLQFLESDLQRATNILNQLEDRAAAIRTERRQLVAVRSLAPATPPQMPIDDGLMNRIAVSMSFAFLFPVLIGALRPKYETVSE